MWTRVPPCPVGLIERNTARASVFLGGTCCSLDTTVTEKWSSKKQYLFLQVPPPGKDWGGATRR